jgi:penicillin-binding protein-related factor A (putative recombinase)
MSDVNSFRQKRRTKMGEFGESVVRRALDHRNYFLIERVHTPWKVIRIGGKIVSAFPVEKVSGDFRAVTADGHSVLIEVKSREDGNLPYSAFQPHQIASLNTHAARPGAVTQIAWVRGVDVCFFDWPIQALRPGTSLKWPQKTN